MLKASDVSVKRQAQNNFCFIFKLKQLQCFEFTQNPHFIKYPVFFLYKWKDFYAPKVSNIKVTLNWNG